VLAANGLNLQGFSHLKSEQLRANVTDVSTDLLLFICMFSFAIEKPCRNMIDLA
jgi:hypothetical protein